MKGTFLLIGTGASTGIPIIGCTCPVCTSTLSFNKRLRPSALVKVDGKQFVIDAGPDYRQQALKYGITKLNGVLLTHSHYDHVAGLEELRPYWFFGDNKMSSMPCLLSTETLSEVRVLFHYMMEEQEDGTVLSTRFQFHELKKLFGFVVFEELPVSFFTYTQVGMNVTGFRVGNLAYVPDISEYDEQVFESLAGVEILVVDALMERESRAHFSLTEAIVFAQKIGAEKVYFTHIAHEMDHEKVSRKLPDNMQLAYDGLELEFEV